MLQLWIRTAKTIYLKPNQPSTKLFINQAKFHNCYNALLYDGFLLRIMLGKKEIISILLKREVLELDWNILNECIDKIESFRFENNLFYTVEIHREGCRITRNWTTSKEKDFGWHQTGNKFLSTTNAICQFISNVL